MTSTRPEEALLLHSVRHFVGSERRVQAFSLLSRVTDWPYLLRLAAQHGVTPLLPHFLEEAGGEVLPEPYAHELEAQERNRVRHNLSLTSQLLATLDLLESNSIPAVAFKGPVLATELYGDLALRDFDDIDILIRRQDVLGAKDALLANAYSTDLPTRPDEQAAYLRSRYEIHFTASGGALVEIHQAFLAPFFSVRFDYQALWSRLERKSFCGREIRALAPADLLLVLCAHGTKHGWSRLAWICDIARLLVIHGSELDWGKITKAASSMGARGMLLLGLLLANRLLSAPVPDDLLKAATSDGSTLHLALAVERSLFAPDDSPNDMEGHRFFLKTRERWRDKFTYCTHLAFMPTEEDQSTFPLPALLSPLRYPLHAFRVFQKYGLTSLKSLL